jgi:hypothetical protein
MKELVGLVVSIDPDERGFEQRPSLSGLSSERLGFDNHERRGLFGSLEKNHFLHL